MADGAPAAEEPVPAEAEQGQPQEASVEEASGVLEDEPPAVNAEEPAEPVTAQPDDEIAAPVESPAADADAVEAADAEEGEEPAAADEFTEAQRLIKRRLRSLLLGTEGQDTDTLPFSLVADLLPSADVAWDDLGLDWYTIGVRVEALLRLNPEGGDTWNNIWLSLSAEPTDLELEVAKLRICFEANVRSKLERWEIEKCIQAEGIKLEALGISPALMNSFVVGEVEGEAAWTLESFLGWFPLQRDAEAAAAAEAGAAEARRELEREAERERLAAEAADRSAADDAARNARQSQEKALIARLSLYDVDSDEEDAEAMERNRVAEVSRWDAKDVADWVATEIGLPQYRICFEANNFHGGRLLAITMDTLPKLSIRQFDHCKMIMNGVRRLKGIREKKIETLRELNLGQRFDPPPQIHDKLKTLRFGSTQDYQLESRIVQEAYTTPVLLQQ